MSWRTLEILVCCIVAVMVTTGIVSGKFQDAADRSGSRLGYAILVCAWLFLIAILFREIRKGRDE